MTETVHDVPTDAGPGRLHVVAGAEVRVLLVLGGGHSGQVATVDLDAVAAALPARGVAVARFELPWRVAGKKVGPRPPASDPLWTAGVDAARALHPGVPLLTGGRSAGARIACRTWTSDVAAVVALSFPLHPPGKPDASRIAELTPVAAPVLLVSGARDPFGTPEELRAALAASQAGSRRLVVVPGATHAFPRAAAPALVEAVATFAGSVARN